MHSKDTAQVSLWLCRSATVQKLFQQGWQRSPKTMCIVKILYKYLGGSAEVPQPKTFSTRLTEIHQNHVHSKDTAQVSLWLCKSATVQNFFNRVDRDPPKTMCIVKILYKYLYGSAEVPQSKNCFNRVGRDPPKTMCIVKILYKYLDGSAEVPQSKIFFNRVGRDPPKPCA